MHASTSFKQRLVNAIRPPFSNLSRSFYRAIQPELIQHQRAIGPRTTDVGTLAPRLKSDFSFQCLVDSSRQKVVT